LRNWTISSSTTTGRINGTYLLQPDSLVVLCSSGALSSYQLLGPTISVSGFPALDNEGDTLQLRSPSGKLVHALAWDKSWYRSELKEDGGFSLEMLDDGRPCAGSENWKASINDRGATPGKTNSVRSSLKDSTPPHLLFAYFRDSITLRLVMSETLSEPLGDLIVDGNRLTLQVLQPPLFNVVDAVTPLPQKPEQLVEVSARGYRDCSQNQLKQAELKAGVFSTALPGDLVINEILFDPPTNGYDYVEIYNKSGKNIDIAKLRLANRGTDGRIASITPLRAHPYPLLPGEYLLITEDSAWIKKYYGIIQISRTVEPSSLPSFPDDGGEVILMGDQGNILDELHYDDQWHFDLVTNRRGISLERISPSGPTQEASNWHSASTSSGFGTPGYRNSQYRANTRSDDSFFSLSGRIISPDMDGRDDFLLVDYRFPNPGYLLNIRIFTLAGQLVAYPVNNLLAGTTGTIMWGGVGQTSSLLPPGHYVIVAQYFSREGSSKGQKFVISIVR
jgi:hypothetical protein